MLTFSFPGGRNSIFFIILWVIMFYIVGLDPMAIFVSISSFVIGFAFMIGNASSKYFSGLLFILVRRKCAVYDPSGSSYRDVMRLSLTIVLDEN